MKNWKTSILCIQVLFLLYLLQFEWAWQHPQRSRRLRTILPTKSRKMTKYQWLIALLARMLSVDPWRRLPLVIRWLLPQYKTAFPVSFLNCFKIFFLIRSVQVNSRKYIYARYISLNTVWLGFLNTVSNLSYFLQLEVNRWSSMLLWSDSMSVCDNFKPHTSLALKLFLVTILPINEY
jgi:hypothetical protein